MIRAFLESFKYCFTLGRTGRKGFWWAQLVYFIVYILLFAVPLLIPYTLGMLFNSSAPPNGGSIALIFAIGFLNLIFLVACIAFFILSITLQIRRLHDIGRSGWFCLLLLIPYLGDLVLIVMSCFPSKEDNQFGPKPVDGYTTLPFPPDFPPSSPSRSAPLPTPELRYVDPLKDKPPYQQ